MENIYYNRITELLKDRVKLSNIVSETHNAIDWISLSSECDFNIRKESG